MSSAGLGPTGPQDGPRWFGLKRTPLRRYTRLRRFGKKARRDAQELRDVKPELLARSGGYCEARVSKDCTKVGTDPHHVRRRSQGGGNGGANLLWVCRCCHECIHAHPESSRELGLLAGAAK